MKQRYLEDLNYFLNCANQKRGKKLDKKFPNETIHLDFYFLHSKEELNDFIKKYENEHKINNDYDFLLLHEMSYKIYVWKTRCPHKHFHEEQQ